MCSQEVIAVSVSEKLVEIREAHGYTRKRLAEELGRPYATITKYETGEREPGHEYLIEVAKKFGVTTDYILGLEQKNPPEVEDKTPEGIAKWMLDLLVKNGYLVKGQDIDDRTASFLIHWFGALDAWFSK